jgi:predicted flap endonuclease-1-like 5' DNA nuclease
MKIEDVEGIGPAFAEKLQGAGVATVEALLDRAGPRKGRETLAEVTGISPKLILEWTNHADLMRIKGVGPEYADLLEAAGVDSCAELAQRNAANLTRTFGELDAARNTVRRIPSESEVTRWIEEAATMSKVVEH